MTTWKPEVEPPDRSAGQMPPGWKPTPPTAAARAATAQRIADELAGRIAEAEADGNRAAVFALTDLRAKKLHLAKRYAARD